LAKADQENQRTGNGENMTVALMIFATAAAYAAGIATMLVLSARRSALARPILPAWLPQTVKVEPPPKPPPPRLPIAPTPTVTVRSEVENKTEAARRPLASQKLPVRRRIRRGNGWARKNFRICAQRFWPAAAH
jgi:hypothetical protein